MKLLFILLSCCLLFACTITKRHFGAGYHIEWKRNLEKKKPDENPQGKFPLETSELKDSSEKAGVSESVAVIPENPFKEMEGNPISSTDDEERIAVGTKCIAFQQKEKQPKIDHFPILNLEEPVPEVKKKTEPLTWVSMGILIGLGISMGLISVFSSFLYLGTGVFIFGLVLVVFICSLISLIRVCRHPDRYKNKGLTKFIFVLSATCLVATALYFLFVGAMASMKPMMQGI